MDSKVKVFLDPVANAMNIWWDKPKEAAVSEETESMINNNIIIKNAKGVPIGLEIIGVFPEELNIVKLWQKRFSLIKNEPFLLES